MALALVDVEFSTPEADLEPEDSFRQRILDHYLEKSRKLVWGEITRPQFAADMTAHDLAIEQIIASQEKELQELRKLLDRDELTGILNRRGFDSRIEAEVAKQKRQRGKGDTRPSSLLFIDLDNFKRVNDQLGHPIGDELLKLCAQIMKESTRLEDLTARYGGDEFIVFLPETEMDIAKLVAERIQQKILEQVPKTIPDINWPQSVSIGTSCLDADISLAEMKIRADQNMYQEKKDHHQTAESPVLS